MAQWRCAFTHQTEGCSCPHKSTGRTEHPPAQRGMAPCPPKFLGILHMAILFDPQQPNMAQ